MQGNDTSTSKDTTIKIDLHQKVTDTIVQQLEAGTTPWQRPWKSIDTSFKLPQNLVTSRPYSGINILLLWGSAMEKEFTSHEWASFRQWNEKKESIRKGEQGTMVVYYDFLEKEENGEMKKIPFMKSYTVFNRCQLASYKSEDQATPATPLADRLEHVETFVANTKAVVKHRGTKACFVPTTDEIKMPKRTSFIDTEHSTATENYYSTLGHELIHWVGHPNRLNRDFGKRFGDQTYAAEELVAELGAAFLCAELQISREPRKDHASYIANWLQALKNNKYLITGAANNASKAVEYLKTLQP